MAQPVINKSPGTFPGTGASLSLGDLADSLCKPKPVLRGFPSHCKGRNLKPSLTTSRPRQEKSITDQVAPLGGHPAFLKLTGDDVRSGQHAANLVSFWEQAELMQAVGELEQGGLTILNRGEELERSVANAGVERFVLVEQHETFAEALDHVPDLVGLIAEHKNHGEVPVVGHVLDAAEGVLPVVAEIDVQLGDGLQKVVEAAGDFDVVHSLCFFVFNGVIAADGDLFNA